MITHIHTDTHTIINTQSQTHWYTHLVSRFPIGLCLIHYLERTMSLKVEVERMVYYMLKLCAFQSLDTLQCRMKWFLCSRINSHLRILLCFEFSIQANDLKWFEVLFPSIHFSTQFKLIQLFCIDGLVNIFCCIFFSNSKLYLLLVIRRRKLMLKWPSTRFIFCSTRVLRLGIFYANWLENSLWIASSGKHKRWFFASKAY